MMSAMRAANSQYYLQWILFSYSGSYWRIPRFCNHFWCRQSKAQCRQKTWWNGTPQSYVWPRSRQIYPPSDWFRPGKNKICWLLCYNFRTYCMSLILNYQIFDLDLIILYKDVHIDVRVIYIYNCTRPMLYTLLYTFVLTICSTKYVAPLYAEWAHHHVVWINGK